MHSNLLFPNNKMETEIIPVYRHNSYVSSKFLVKIFPELIEIGNFACEA